MPSRRTFIKSSAVAAMASSLLAPVSLAQSVKRKKTSRDQIDERLVKAVGYLRSQQNRDGTISDNHENRNAMTALAIMAMAAVGHQPSDLTPEGQAMRRALAYILRPENQTREGYFGQRDGSRMYGHGIITLMLSEMTGMGPSDDFDEIVLQRLEKAVDLILRSQRVRKSRTYQGGWRYNPSDSSADLSISVWQLMALRSARNAGMEIPASAIDSAVIYLKRSYYSDRRNGKLTRPISGFSYTPGSGPTYSTTSAGMLALQVCGEYDSPEVKGAADWLMRNRPKLHWGEQWFYYGTYYYAQAMYQRGDRYAEHARQEVERILAPQQLKDGSWPRGPGGSVYATTLAMLSLSVKYHYLPIYQR